MRFLFTCPTFIEERAEKEKREFYIPRTDREKSIYGTEFEIKLRNDLTQKAIAKECADWIRRKVSFKSNRTKENMPGFYVVNNNDSSYAYYMMNGFTTVDLGVVQLYWPVSADRSLVFPPSRSSRFSQRHLLFKNHPDLAFKQAFILVPVGKVNAFPGNFIVSIHKVLFVQKDQHQRGT